jgi:hypothetical protein
MQWSGCLRFLLFAGTLDLSCALTDKILGVEIWMPSFMDHSIQSIDQEVMINIHSLHSYNRETLQHVENVYVIVFPKVYFLPGLTVHSAEIVNATSQHEITMTYIQTALEFQTSIVP